MVYLYIYIYKQADPPTVSWEEHAILKRLSQ